MAQVNIKDFIGEVSNKASILRSKGEEPEPEAGPDPDALVPLTFELPADPVEPVEEPAAEPAAEEGAE